MKLIRFHNSPRYIPAFNHPTLRAEMDRLLEAAFPTLSSLQQNGFFKESRSEFPVDLFQNKDAFIVRAELPGFRKEDLGIEVTDGVLTVTGHQKAVPASQEKPESAAPERRLSRSLSLPEQLDLDKINAAYENGVLTVTLPKREEVKPRQIAVDVQ